LCAIAAVLLPPRLAAFFTLMALLAYAALWRFNQPLSLPPDWNAHWSWLGTWAVFSVSTLVLVWFVSRMKEAVLHRELALAQAREIHLRNQWLSFMGNLAAGAAHQMSTPLATLQILSDTLIEEHPDQPDLKQDLIVMQAQIAQCKESLTALTARAGLGRTEQSRSMPFSQWLEGLVGAWQSTHPTQNLGWAAAPRLQKARFYPDPELEQILQTLLLPPRPNDALHIEARDEGDEVVLEVTLPPNDTDAPPTEPLTSVSDEMASRRLLWMGGRTQVRMRSPTLQERRIYIPQAAILWT
jgi:two-component system sensor histidine kinase RegB